MAKQDALRSSREETNRTCLLHVVGDVKECRERGLLASLLDLITLSLAYSTRGIAADSVDILGCRTPTTPSYPTNRVEA